jgi:hypothetical protein
MLLDQILVTLSPYMILICLSGVTLGILWGAMPGLSTTMAMVLLIGIIILYVIVTQQIAFDLRFPTKFFAFSFSSYELISIITLTLILRIFWRATLVRCLLVSVFWIIALASVFRYAFHILLPGLG